MKNISIYLIGLFAPIASAMAVNFPTASNPPVSQYGLIQNVQHYSSNPFWSPDAPYNQRMPTPVYVQGADLNAGECQSIVAQLVAQQCGSRNNCMGIRLNDIKPAIMVQMSKLPGHNYVTACGGFIDGAFNDYIAQYSSGVQGAAFPIATVQGGGVTQQPKFEIPNPYEVQMPKWHNEEWYKGIVDRAVELQDLQSQNGAGHDGIVRADMPTTYADLSFTERMENARAGYEQWAPVYGTNSQGQRVCIQNCAYQTLNVESDVKRYQREADEATLKALAEKAKLDEEYYADPTTYCKKYPTDVSRGCGDSTGAIKPQTGGLNSEMVQRIAEALKAAKI